MCPVCTVYSRSHMCTLSKVLNWLTQPVSHYLYFPSQNCNFLERRERKLIYLPIENLLRNVLKCLYHTKHADKPLYSANQIVSTSADSLKCVKIFGVHLVLPCAMRLGLCLFQTCINSLFLPVNNSNFYIAFTLHKASQVIKR